MPFVEPQMVFSNTTGFAVLYCAIKPTRLLPHYPPVA
jgi:hypothetical protein